MKRAVLIALVCVIGFSCETTFTPNLPDNGSGVVVYSFFRPDAPIRFDVFETTPIMSKNALSRRRDLSIRLIKNGEFVEQVTANAQGSYVSSQIPVSGDHYKFEALDQAGMLSGSNYIPPTVPVVSAEVSDELEDIDVGKYGYPAQITLRDPGDSVNFYAFEVLIDDCRSGCSSSNLDGVVNELLVEEVKVNTSGNTDVNIGGGPERIDGLPYFYFNDDDFNGEAITIKFFIIPVHLNFEENPNVIVKFVLKSITKEYYDYLRTSDFQLKAEDGNSFAEPVQVSSNIRNGLGTFAGYNYSVFSIRP